MKKKQKIYLGIGALAVVMLIALMYASGGTEAETVEAKLGGVAQTVTDTGYVQSVNDYVLHTTQSVRVVDTAVETGQAVQPGQTLVVLKNLDLALQISEARSQQSQANVAVTGSKTALERARLELVDADEGFARVQQLYQAGAASKADFDRSKTLAETCRQNVIELEARLEGARQQAASLNQLLEQLNAKERELVVKSPIAGVVLNLPVEKEQVLMPGSPLVTVGSADLMEVKADILSDDLGKVRLGQKAAVTAPVLDNTVLEGEVTKIYPQAEEKVSALGVIQRRVPVIISLKENSILKPGFEVKVSIETESRQNVLVLPREAVRTIEDGQKEVMVVVNGRVRHQAVQTGISNGETVEITGGLQAGDKVVRDGSLNLAEKARVKGI